MITVQRQETQTSQKVVSTFLKRVKKSNTMARLRKSRYYSKALSTLKKKRKAISTAKYKSEEELIRRVGKK